WEELGAGTAGYGTLGHRRRSVLDLLAVERVKPIWNAAYPGDGAVDEVIDAARKVLDGEQSAEWATQLQSRTWVALLDRMSADQKFSAGDVGQAVCAALSTAAHDKPYDDLPPDVDDYDLDSDAWDASFLAAMAAAGGEVGSPVASDERRREFWEWYLREAVPSAWRSAG
ncbi:MAG: Imm5 family immunity protein, partial [Acidimicrobiales bacterium]